MDLLVTLGNIVLLRGSRPILFLSGWRLAGVVMMIDLWCILVTSRKCQAAIEANWRQRQFYEEEEKKAPDLKSTSYLFYSLSSYLHPIENLVITTHTRTKNICNPSLVNTTAN